MKLEITNLKNQKKDPNIRKQVTTSSGAFGEDAPHVKNDETVHIKKQVTISSEPFEDTSPQKNDDIKE